MLRKTLVSFWDLLSSFHRTFKIFVGLIVIYELLQMAGSYTISLVISLFESSANVNTWIAFLVGYFIFVEVAMRMDNALDWFIISRHSYPLYKHLKLGAVKKFFDMDMKWHTQNMSGALIGKVASGVEKSNNILNDLSWEFMPTMIQTVVSIIPLLFLSLPTAVICVVALALFMYLSIKGNRARQQYREPRHDLYESEWHKSIEDIQSIEMAIMFGQRDRVLGEHDTLHSKIVDLGLVEGKMSVYRYNRWRIRVLNSCRTGILIFLIYQLMNGQISIASLVFVNVLVERLFSSYWRFARLFDRFEESAESIRRLIGIMNETPNMENQGTYSEETQNVGIELSHVSFSYDPDAESREDAIHDLNLDIEAGTIVALVGPSGAGKTTIRKILARLYDIQEGMIRVNGVDIREWDVQALRNLFSYVPQGDDVHIHAKTIGANIAYPMPDASIEEVMEAARLAGIHDFIVSLPAGYETLLGERGQKLSGGQKQRIALARAIIADRPVVIFDEATSAIDSITEAEIQANLPEILHGKTAIIIAHRLSTVRDSDKIVVLDHGTKVEEGTHAELTTQDGLYAHMVDLQMTS